MAGWANVCNGFDLIRRQTSRPTDSDHAECGGVIIDSVDSPFYRQLYIPTSDPSTMHGVDNSNYDNSTSMANTKMPFGDHQGGTNDYSLTKFGRKKNTLTRDI